jgi:hypothetical protein
MSIITNTIPTDEPTEFVSGETVIWRKVLPEQPPPDWTLCYYFRPRSAGATGFDVTATNDGGTHLVTVAATVSNVTPGVYVWQAWVVNGSDKRMVDSSEVTINPSFASSQTSDSFDTRSQAEKDLEAVRLALVGTLDAMRYRIGTLSGGRELQRFSKGELMELEKSLAQRVNAERCSVARKRGGGVLKNVKVRFGDE